MLMHQWLNIFLCFGQICTFNILKHKNEWTRKKYINPLNAELNPIRHLLAVVGARHIVHVSRVRVKESKAHRAVLLLDSRPTLPVC